MKKLLIIVAALLGTLAPAATPAPQFRAGAATSNITPALGLKIVGGFAPYPAQHIHDELHARCLVLDDGKTKLALVVCDLLGLHRSLSIEARRLIQETTGIPPENVIISATHTHSAASALGLNRYTTEQPLDDYQSFVARRIADGVRRATNLLRPAQIAFGTTEAPEHVHNRRWLVREDSAPVSPFGKKERVKMNPQPGSPDLIEPAGPIDPTVSFIALREPNGQPIALYSAYSLHYVGGVSWRHISADYYGMYREALKKLQNVPGHETPFVALMANGTSGDANNRNFLKPRKRKPPYEQMRHVAHDLANKVNATLARVVWEDGAELDALFQEVDIAWREIDAELLEWARQIEAAAPRLKSGDVPVGAKWPTTPNFTQRLSYAGRVQVLAAARGPTKVPLQVLRIGDICIGTSPCETFAETGLDFKKRSPFRRSFMVGLAHGYIGYLPTPRHYELGGYETWPGTNILETQAAVKIMDALLEMAGNLRRNNGRG